MNETSFKHNDVTLVDGVEHMLREERAVLLPEREREKAIERINEIESIGRGGVAPRYCYTICVRLLKPYSDEPSEQASGPRRQAAGRSSHSVLPRVPL